MLWVLRGVRRSSIHGVLSVETELHGNVRLGRDQPERVHRMDRLSALIAIALACGACEDKKPEPSGEAPSRVNGAKVGSAQKASTVAFCDVHHTDDSGPALQIPPVGEVKIPATAKGSWTWLNIWATWCKPCIDEMPRIARWHDKLGAAGKHVDLAFVSIDEADADITAFEKLHPGTPPSARLADLKTQGAWFKQLGLDDGSPIPIHVFVSPTGHIRCARAGGIREQDYAAIELLLGE